MVVCSIVVLTILCILYLSCRLFLILFFFFKQKTAYEMRISDWSSDVCSSDLIYEVFDFTKSILRKYSIKPFVLTSTKEEGASSIEVLFLQIGRASCRERVCQYV